MPSCCHASAADCAVTVRGVVGKFPGSIFDTVVSATGVPATTVEQADSSAAARAMAAGAAPRRVFMVPPELGHIEYSGRRPRAPGEPDIRVRIATVRLSGLGAR